MNAAHPPKENPGVGALGAFDKKKLTGANSLKGWSTRQHLRETLDTAKANVGIATVWHALGLLGEPRLSCRSPFREDRHPSFSISADGRLWYDHATGEGGDVVTFIATALGCDCSTAIHRLREIADGGLCEPIQLRPIAPKPSTTYKKKLPDLVYPTFADVRALSELREWPSVAAIEIAGVRGLLRMASIIDDGERIRAWVLTDAARATAQARRLDGKPWNRMGAKSDTLRSDTAHPIGLAALGNRPVVALCEGEPDSIAALHFAFIAGIADHVAPLCLTGAAKRIPEAVAQQLRGRQVRIFRQSDTAGHSATLKWAEGLEAAGVAVSAVNLDGLTAPDGTPAKDIADLARWPVETWTDSASVALDAEECRGEGPTLGPVSPAYFNLWEGVRL